MMENFKIQGEEPCRRRRPTDRRPKDRRPTDKRPTDRRPTRTEYPQTKDPQLFFVSLLLCINFGAMVVGAGDSIRFPQ